MQAQSNQSYGPGWTEALGSRPRHDPLSSGIRRATDLPPPIAAVALDDPGFSLFDAYRRSGDVLTSEEFIHILREHFDQPISKLARRIVARELVVFSWRRETMIPMFQFDPETRSSRAEILILLAELPPVFDDNEVARWFVQPSQWLADASPLSRLSDDFGAVLHAARTDRFIATG